jgi:hypothetical protein
MGVFIPKLFLERVTMKVVRNTVEGVRKILLNKVYDCIVFLTLENLIVNMYVRRNCKEKF